MRPRWSPREQVLFRSQGSGICGISSVVKLTQYFPVSSIGMFSVVFSTEQLTWMTFFTSALSVLTLAFFRGLTRSPIQQMKTNLERTLRSSPVWTRAKMYKRLPSAGKNRKKIPKLQDSEQPDLYSACNTRVQQYSNVVQRNLHGNMHQISGFTPQWFYTPLCPIKVSTYPRKEE